MSIKKAKPILKAKLKKFEKKIIAGTPHKEIILNGEEFDFLPYIDGYRCLEDIARLAKRGLNRLLKDIIRLEDLGIIELRLFPESPLMRDLYEKKRPVYKICKEHPGMYNVIAYEREWSIYPLVLDFLDRSSENYKLKDLEKKIYLDIIRPFFNEIPKGSNIIDAGGGIGRFAAWLCKTGHKTQIVDSSPTALKKALKHLYAENLVDFDLHLGDAACLTNFADNTFDAALAIELVCYSDRPAQIVKELARVTKKNGILVFSVEGKYGALFSDPNVSLDKIPLILREGILKIKDHLYVRYYSPASLVKLLKENGIEVIGTFGTHYVTDGILHKLINVDKLNDNGYKKDIFKIEKMCRNDPVLQNFARAWVAIGRKR
ncbi:MAG: class I SAM-dependent methyltransferase [Candidatus Omnitrophica bacterium]|nr:class I SAM-dependent methyltransferase [Candidatus Omnitrophota bacterium]MDD5553802.1 class I SAM-dependent methyltransferase [Candidatus Omnitrophota bacterium]